MSSGVGVSRGDGGRVGVFVLALALQLVVLPRVVVTVGM